MQQHKDNGIWISAEDLSRDKEFLAKTEQEFAPISLETVADEASVGGWSASRRDFLKMLGFGLGAATVASACETPIKKAIPYVTKPDSIVPGVANYYASTFMDGGDAIPVLVKTREGRPIKIEGNSLSSVTGGGTSARAQASILSLYDYKRIQSPGTVDGEGNVTAMSWADLDKKVKSALAGGRQAAIIMGTNVSPSAKAALAEFTARYSSAVAVVDPVSHAAMQLANEATFAVKGIPSYHFDKASVIVSFGADFLGTWISPVAFAKAYTKGRKITDTSKPKMSRHYQVEGFMSLTGSNADNRILIKPSEQGAAIAYLFSKVVGGGAGPALNDKAKTALDKVAAELRAAAGSSLVVSDSNNVTEQKMVNAINATLGAIGNTVDFNRLSMQAQGNEADLASLVRGMNSGSYGVAIVWGANPSYTSPKAAEFDAAFAKVPVRISFAGTMDETSRLCTHVAPDNHYLESWGDAEIVEGQYSMVQPTIAPLFNTRQAPHSLLTWAESANLGTGEQPYYDYVQARWKNNMFGLQTKYAANRQAFWDMALHDGIFETGGSGRTVSFDGSSINAGDVSKPGTSELEIAFYETVNIGGGQYAHNPWLQEMPDPVTRCVWGNYLHIPVEWDGINTITGWMGLTDGDNVTVSVGGKELVCTVTKTFGLAPGVVALALGQGRRSVGAGQGYGVDVTPVLPVSGNGLTQYYASGVTVTPISGSDGKDKNFACVQYHHTMGVKAFGEEEQADINVDEKTLGWKGFQGSLTDRSIIKAANVKDLPAFVKEVAEFRKEAAHLNAQTLYDDTSEFFGTGVHWGMHVDMSACIGCGACQVACVAENNVPMVGKNEVHRHHEMTWLRIDRYFYGDFENPQVVYQPMMCQHCDNAPCENVCPVAATSHSMEGINQMTYNRCIGTRYCANNCPYKVRRFNWLDYTTADLWPSNEERGLHVPGEDMPYYADNLVRMVLNPDVTVRSRGVIEKCSFCVQRIQEGKLTAKKESRKLIDTDVRTACQTACPTGAIVFGNMNNPDSEVSKAKETNLGYKVLEEINVRPGVSYSAIIHNKNEEVIG